MGEHGIAELEGQGEGFSSMALTTASHRAWRLIQVPHSLLLLCLPEACITVSALAAELLFVFSTGVQICLFDCKASTWQCGLQWSCSSWLVHVPARELQSSFLLLAVREARLQLLMSPSSCMPRQ